MQNEVKREIIEDRQLIIPGDSYNHEHVAVVPPREQWSVWNPPTMREAKRAYRQIELYLRKGDSSLEWFEGWANTEPANRTPVLSFGTFSRGRWEQKPNGSWGYAEDKSEFQNWLYGMVERMGWEATDMDQTTRCDGCNLAIDTGSSTPDYNHLSSSGETYCNKCANESLDCLIESIENFEVHLRFRPTFEGFDFDTTLTRAEFGTNYEAESFAKAWLKKFATFGSSLFFFANELPKIKSDSPMEEAFGVIQYFPVRATILDLGGAWNKSNDRGYRTAQGEGLATLATRIKHSGIIDPGMHPVLCSLVYGNMLQGVLFDEDIKALEYFFAGDFEESGEHHEAFAREASRLGIQFEVLEEN